MGTLAGEVPDANAVDLSADMDLSERSHYWLSSLDVAVHRAPSFNSPVALQLPLIHI